MRKAERAAYVAAGGVATVAETATSGDHDPGRSRRCPPACRSSIQGIVACSAWSDPILSRRPVVLTSLQNARQFAHGRRLIEQMTYSRVDVREKKKYSRQATRQPPSRMKSCEASTCPGGSQVCAYSIVFICLSWHRRSNR